MKINDIVTVYMAYVDNPGGKKRPVLIQHIDAENYYVLKITSQYANKSDKIRAKYFPLLNWQALGLNQMSYIDTNSIRPLKRTAFKSKMRIINHLDSQTIKQLESFMTTNTF
jgi:hypothetical protein